MTITVSPSSYSGEISANPSKSIMQRAIALAALSADPTLIYNPDRSADSVAALSVAEAMGCEIEYHKDHLRIIPGKKLKTPIWNVKESGLSARIFAHIAGLFGEDITITGEGSLLKRPMDSLIYSLTLLNLEVSHKDGFLPISIKGKIKNHKLHLDLKSGSQVLTGLLFALTQTGRNSKITISNLASLPYIDISISILKDFGAQVNNTDYKLFDIKGNQKLSKPKYKIEGDWSGVAFHLVGAAISGCAEIIGINPQSNQGDRIILDILQKSGAKLRIKHNKVKIEKNVLHPFRYDATHTPDLFPPLAVLALNCDGISKIKGISRLINKESDRFQSLKNEFYKLGLQLESEGDYMIIHPGVPDGGTVNSNNDHRIAMALATLGLVAKDNITIDQAECVQKSYPDFFDHYEKLGGKIISVI